MLRVPGIPLEIEISYFLLCILLLNNLVLLPHSVSYELKVLFAVSGKTFTDVATHFNAYLVLQ